MRHMCGIKVGAGLDSLHMHLSGITLVFILLNLLYFLFPAVHRSLIVCTQQMYQREQQAGEIVHSCLLLRNQYLAFEGKDFLGVCQSLVSASQRKMRQTLFSTPTVFLSGIFTLTITFSEVQPFGSNLCTPCTSVHGKWSVSSP